MTAQQITANEIVTFDDLKQLARTGGPCITIVVPIPTPLELSPRMKNAARVVERSLTERGLDSGAVQSLLEPVRELAEAVETARIWSNALILFRSPELFRYFLLHRREPEMQTVEERFQVRPLLAAVTREQRFALLGLNQQHIRILECTQHRAGRAGLRGLVPTNLKDWLQMRPPDHVLDNRSTGGPSIGSMKGVVFGTSSDREREDKYLAHFFKAVDEGVNKLLPERTERLLLAGVEEEVALYRRVSVYPRIFKNAVEGSPDGVSDAELHRRAMDAVMGEPSEALEKSLSHFEKHRDDVRVVSDVRAVIKAAWEGRVSDLFVSERAEFRGAWNPETLEADPTDPREDLLNAAALQTLLQGGEAFSLEEKEMPDGRDAIAVLRF